jgi:hypothetical protein
MEGEHNAALCDIAEAIKNLPAHLAGVLAGLIRP